MFGTKLFETEVRAVDSCWVVCVEDGWFSFFGVSCTFWHLVVAICFAYLATDLGCSASSMAPRVLGATVAERVHALNAEHICIAVVLQFPAGLGFLCLSSFSWLDKVLNGVTK